MGTPRVNGGVLNPLYRNNKEKPQPDRNAESQSKTPELDKVKVRLAFGGELSRQTRDAVAQALWEDVPKAFHVPKKGKNAVAKLVASMLSEGLDLPLEETYGVVTETPRGRLLERVGLRKNRRLGGREEYTRRLFEESQERRSLGRLVSSIRSAEDLEVLQTVLRDRATRTTIREKAASIEIDCLAELSFLTSAEVRSAILEGLKLAFPEASKDDRQRQLQDIARKAGWNMKAADIPSIDEVRQLQFAFHRLIRKDVDIRVIQGQFREFRRLDTFVDPALIVEKVLAGLGERRNSELPLEAGDLSGDERKALEKALKDRDFKKMIREQVVTDAIMRHFSEFNDHPSLVVNKVLFRLKLPLQAGTLNRDQLKVLAKALNDPEFTATMQQRVEADLRSFDAQVEAVVNEDIENLI